MTIVIEETPTVRFPAGLAAKEAIKLSVRVGNRMRERVGKGNVLSLDPQMLRTMFPVEEEYVEALRLRDLVQWVRKVGPYAHQRGLRDVEWNIEGDGDERQRINTG